ncbi:hypothetical protein HKX48_000110 [Thoreauomyces humboldtii]|nr:hypothetical protein HKX48_000110 [Thoreauomyces humboldtii]
MDAEAMTYTQTWQLPGRSDTVARAPRVTTTGGQHGAHPVHNAAEEGVEKQGSDDVPFDLRTGQVRTGWKTAAATFFKDLQEPLKAWNDLRVVSMRTLMLFTKIAAIGYLLDPRTAPLEN